MADEYSADPPEFPGGQDDMPDLDHLLRVLARELDELSQPESQMTRDRRLRLAALWAVIQRFRGESDGG